MEDSMMARPQGIPENSSVVIFVYVEDVDRTVERALGHGARLLLPAQNQFWGDRTAWIMDPASHVWTIASRIEATTEEQSLGRYCKRSAETLSSDPLWTRHPQLRGAPAEHAGSARRFRRIGAMTRNRARDGCRTRGRSGSWRLFDVAPRN
jgi:hypothetical protein